MGPAGEHRSHLYSTHHRLITVATGNDMLGTLRGF